ncbi:MAG: hypothetical protein KKA64_00280 [Nanoarchaeota archaeon]|nr:hypothetical protein [Nanoarchaeota archaeon]
MKLEEITNRPIITLLDTNVLKGSSHSFLQKIYDVLIPDDLPVNHLETEIKAVDAFSPYLEKENVFVTSEVTKELKYFLDRLNDSVKHHNTLLKSMGNKRNLRRYRRQFEIRDIDFDNHKKNSPVSLLNVLAQKWADVVKSSKNKNILDTFSPDEENLYYRFFTYFIEACKKHSLKRDSTPMYDGRLRSRHPCDFGTDEGLISVALTISQKQPVQVISSDIDLGVILDFFYNNQSHKSSLVRPNPKHSISLYSAFGGRDEYTL